jgi:hypothetical protein
MKNSYPVLKNCILNAEQLNILPSPRVKSVDGKSNFIKHGAKALCMLLFLLAVGDVNAGSLVTSPNNSQLTIIVANNSTGLLDKTVVGFNPLSTDSFSPVYDANKLQGLSNRQTLYTMNSGEWMSINELPNEATIDTVEMGIEPGGDATFTFTFSGLNTFDSTSYIYLEDKKLHTWFDLRKGNYTFSSTTSDDWNRFLLHFTPPVIVTGSNTTCSATSTINIQQPGMAIWNYSLTDSANTIVNGGILSQNNPVTLKVTPGNYNLILTDSTGYTAEKTIQVQGPEPVSAVAFNVSDTAVVLMQPLVLTDSVTIPDLTNTGNIYQWNFGNGTAGTGTDTTVTYAQAGTYNLSLTVTNQSGCSATQTQKITVTDTVTTIIDTTAKTPTGVATVSITTTPEIWSNSNRIYVNFTAIQTVDASVTVYNILGQELSNDRFTNSTVYQKEVDNMPAAYLIVKVINNHETFVKKVFISNK